MVSCERRQRQSLVTISLRLALPVIFLHILKVVILWKLVKRLGIIGIFKDSISLWGEDEPNQHLS